MRSEDLGWTITLSIFFIVIAVVIGTVRYYNAVENELFVKNGYVQKVDHQGNNQVIWVKECNNTNP